ncbi:MAG: DNA polymerase II large subunit [archaeon]
MKTKLNGKKVMIWFASWGGRMFKWDVDGYFEDLSSGVVRAYGVARRARALGLDPVADVEVSLAATMVEKAVRLVCVVYPDLPVEKIVRRMEELEKKYGQLDTTVSFVIAREIAEEKFCKFKDKLEAIDVGIRVGFAYMTLGVVSSPIEGYTGLKLGKTREDKYYFIASFSGPIRSAGTTATCVVLMLIDYLREYFGYAKYDVSEDEIKRYVVENKDYHERVANLAYLPTEEEMRFLAARLPIQIDGEPTSRKEVSSYRDLPRVGTNFIRGGMCLIFSEGLAQKAEKAVGRLRSCKKNGLKCTGFDWLEDYTVLHKKREAGEKNIEATYIKDLVAGRPVYGHPSRSGGFRLRYGRGRTSGFSAVSVHPATMGITNGFLSHGTQLKIEKPTKGCIITSCDSIDGPIVKMKNGSVKRVYDYEEARRIYKDVDEIIYLGDMLFPMGDVVDRNFDLLKPGYVEEWWAASLVAEDSGFRIQDPENVGLDEAIELSRKFGLPLHPKYIFYWSQIGVEDFFGLVGWLNKSAWENGKLILPFADEFKVGKRALEILGVEHDVVGGDVVVDKDARAFLINLGIDKIKEGEGLDLEIGGTGVKGVLEIVNGLCEFEIKDKAGTFIGARMGRPEKAKLRDIGGSPNVLFPVGKQGGRLKSIQDAVGVGFIDADFPIYKCGCGNEGIYLTCEKCGVKSKRGFYCRECCGVKSDFCKLHNNCFGFFRRKIGVKDYFEGACKKLGLELYEVPPLIKGISGMVSEGKDVEDLGKGVLRAKFGLCVNKDGTVRYDGTEIPLTHFKPREVGVGVEKLKILGYERDIYGSDLVGDDQILELRPHDIVLPNCSEMAERGGDVFFNVANFVDEELSRFYGMKRFYNLKSRGDLVGQLVVCMAPHNCAGVVGRIIGFGRMQGVIASPYMHAAMRRDCDGDEAAVMLLMDVLLNFSRKFLPGHRGGNQDAPLVLNARIRAGEVDDQILSLESGGKYSLEFYEVAERGEHSSECRVELVKDRLKMGVEPFVGAGFSHDTSDINLGNANGVYKSLPTMKDKVAAEMELVGKIRAVDKDDVARLILERHFIRDIGGNLRKFGRQGFRCANCNEKFRRPPLAGVCHKCKGKIIFTISEGSIKKYLPMARELVKNYNIPSYTWEVFELLEEYVGGIFGIED